MIFMPDLKDPLLHYIITSGLAIISALAQQNNISPVASSADAFIKTIDPFLGIIGSGTQIDYIFPFPDFIRFTPF